MFVSKNRKGFTLIELLVVVAIIGVLASVVLGALNNARAKARDARRQGDIKTIQNALEMYYIDNGQYPVRVFTRSYNSTWTAFETQLGIKLPIDPLNTGGLPYTGGNTYLYVSDSNSYSYSGNCPNGQWYLIAYQPEREIESGESPGIKRCDTGLPYTLGNSITVGVTPRG